jgi:hypothetical protein
MTDKKKKFTSWHVAVAAEAIAAGQFARLGFDISVQYGADQPEYDLIISKKDSFQDILMKISVKGSQDGSWGLTQGFKKNINYHQAVDLWLAKYSTKTIFCFVQFKGIQFEDLPRLYLATPKEIGQRLKESANGRGDTILYENHTYKMKKAAGFGTTDKIPNEWRFSKERIEGLFKTNKIFLT